MTSFSSPEQNIGELNLKENSVVVDLGCGTGHYVFAVANALNALGKKGVVYAVDVQKSLLEKVSAEASRIGLGNVRVVWGDIDIVGGTKLADSIADIVIISNVLFQSENKESFLREGIRLLKARGQMLVVDWLDSYAGMGPSQTMLVRPEFVTQTLLGLGLTKKRDFSAGAHHWGIIFQKS